MLQSGVKFHFDQRCFHALPKLPTKKSYTISLSGHEFYFSLEEVCLFAPDLMKFYQQNHTKFILFSESLSECDQLIKAMQ
jgi:hypothetical protein